VSLRRPAQAALFSGGLVTFALARFSGAVVSFIGARFSDGESDKRSVLSPLGF